MIWAYVGIAIEQAGDPVVVASAWIAAGLIGLILAVTIVRKVPAKQIVGISPMDLRYGLF